MAYGSEISDVPAGLIDMMRRSTIALTLAAADLTDYPLVAVNQAFCRLTGYPPDEMLGRNCRFLQPKGGAGPVRERIRRFLKNDRKKEERFVLYNERFDGSPFLNILYLSKIFLDSRPRFVLGSQFIAQSGIVGPSEYDEALREDVQSIGKLLKGTGWQMQESMDMLANTAALIAQHRSDAV